MRTLRAALAVALCLVLGGWAYARAAAPLDHVARVVAGLKRAVELKGVPSISYRLDDRMREFKVPGVSVAVVDGGRLVWARGFGVRAAGSRDPVTPSTPFQAGSIGKAITATVTLQLVEQRKLALDEDVNDYLKSWKVPENEFTVREKVTLRRLMSHSAGMTVPSFRGYTAGEPLPTVVQVLDGVQPAQTDPVRVDAVPGSLIRYSGGGTTVEQLVLTDATGKDFSRLTRERLLAPLGMADSTFEQTPPPPLAGRLASGHDGTGAIIDRGHLLHPELAAAGLWSTPTDLLKWAMEIAAARAGSSSRLLSQALATQMLTVQKRPLGLGPFLGGTGQGFNFSHRGWNPGFHSKVIYFPETGQGAAVMVNGDGGRGMVDEILRAIGTEYAWPGTTPPPLEPVAVDGAARNGVVGVYQGMKPHAITVTAAVRREGDKLILDAPALGTRDELVFMGPKELISLDRGDRFTVIGEKDGRATALVFGDVRMSRLTERQLAALLAHRGQAGARPYPPLPSPPPALPRESARRGARLQRRRGRRRRPSAS